jgi:hypothetical protein
MALRQSEIVQDQVTQKYGAPAERLPDGRRERVAELAYLG